MTGMNRLSPLIVRSESLRPFVNRPGRSLAQSMNWRGSDFFAGAEPAKWLEELKLFATGWIGGLIFFGTYLS